MTSFQKKVLEEIGKSKHWGTVSRVKSIVRGHAVEALVRRRLDRTIGDYRVAVTYKIDGKVVNTYRMTMFCRGV